MKSAHPCLPHRFSLSSWSVARWRWSAVVCACLLAAPASAFDVDRMESGIPLHFAHMPVVVYFKPAAQGTLTPAQEETALLAALTSWNNVPGTRLQLVYGGIVTDKPLFDVYVAFDPEYKSIGGDVPGGTQRFAGADGAMTRAEIHLNSRQFHWTTKASAATGTTADLQAVLTHQLGHALGLGHSRDANAAMYFYKTSAAGRTLAADDAKAARFAYADAAKAEGDQCDACTTDADCTVGRCLAWPDGYRHCADSCSVSDDCPLGTSCGNYKDGKACLPNDLHCHADAAVAGLGQACDSDTACGSTRYCQTGGSHGFCTAPCPCGPGRCIEFTSGGLCLANGNAAFGDSCIVPSDCASGWCVGSLVGGGRCSLACASAGDSCAKGGTCSAGGSCEVPGTLPLGWPCASGFDCESGMCLAFSGGKYAKACSQACKIAGDCPAGTGCATIGTDSYCLPAGAAALDGPCLTPGACGNKMACDDSPVDGVGACHALCAPYGDDLDCPSGDRCVWVGARSSSGGVCRGVNGGGVAGIACGASAPCRVDLVCAGATAASATCRPDCDLVKGDGCASGQVCAHLGAAEDANGRGACADTDAALTVVPAAAPVGKNFAAIKVDLPAVVPSSEFVAPKAKASATAPGSGCQAGRGGAWSGAWLMLLAGAVVLRRRLAARRVH